MILVIGATGLVGKEVVKQLSALNIGFKAVAHSKASLDSLRKEGVVAIPGDYRDPESLTEVLKGVDKLFLLTPTTPDQDEVEKLIVKKAKQAGLEHILKISSFAADNIVDLPLLKTHFSSEEYLRQSGLNYTILRPNNFMQNLKRSNTEMIKSEGAIFNSAGEGKISFIDTYDIAAVAINILTTSPVSNQVLDLTGPESLTYFEVAEKFSAHLGRKINFVSISDEAMLEAMLKAGVPDWYAVGLVDLYRFYREGKGSGINDTVLQITGRPPRTIDQYIEENLEVFKL